MPNLFTSIDFIINFISILLWSFHIILSQGTCVAILGTIESLPIEAFFGWELWTSEGKQIHFTILHDSTAKVERDKISKKKTTMKSWWKGGMRMLADGCWPTMISPPLFLLKYPFFYEAKLTKQPYQTFTIVSVFQRIFPHGHPRNWQYLQAVA